MDQDKKKIRSTKLTDPLDVLEDIEPKQEGKNTYTGDIMCSIIDTIDITSKSYSDQTGNFPVKSSRDNQYIFILYHFDTNTIRAIPLKSRHTSSIT